MTHLHFFLLCSELETDRVLRFILDALALTVYGEALDIRRSRGSMDTLGPIGPYHARMLWTADNGLILRTSHDQRWSTGLFWERGTHLTDHHPADCLHAIVNIGCIAPHSQRILRGKIYWLVGSGETVVEHWRKDFPSAKSDVPTSAGKRSAN